MQTPEETQGQQPNSAGVVEDPSQIPPPVQVNPESRRVELDPEVEKTYEQLDPAIAAQEPDQATQEPS
jgi:hypothetical protein